MHPNDGRVVSNFIVQALLNRDITIYGEGTQTRSFCYVDDLVDGLISLMKSQDDLIGPINLGNPKEFTMLELATTILELTGSRSKVVHRPLPQDDPRQRQPNISKARQMLNWEPLTPLKEGLMKTITYFEELLLLPDVREILSISE
jgi:UDP-glucuronate decarboxylase